LKYPVIIALSSLILSSGTVASIGMSRSSAGIGPAEDSDASLTSPPAVLSRTDRLVQDPILVAQAATQQPSTRSAPLPADLSALRYFARRGDTVRLQAETARLRALYPTWVPPENPVADVAGGDPQLDAMWKLYGQQRYAEVRKAIAERQKAESAWQPPEDLISMLNMGEARQTLVQSSDLKQYNAVIETASVNEGLLTCADVDVLWRVAEAFAKTDRPQRSRDTYGYILTNCMVPAERIATIQKASTVLPAAMLDGLLVLEKPDASGKPEFEGLRDDIARRFVTEATDNPATTAPTFWLERLQKLAQTNQLASDALLLGWYSYRHNNTKDAEKWFRMAHDKQDTASASQGLALVLGARKDFAAAEQVMYRWRDSSDEARSAYLAAATNLLAQDPAVVIASDVLQRMATATVSAKHADTAQQFGWYARVFQQPEQALKWFSLAVSWQPDDEPSAYGLAVTAQELKLPKDVQRIQTLWAGRSARIASLSERKQGNTKAISSAPSIERENVGSVQPETTVARHIPTNSSNRRARNATAPRQAGPTSCLASVTARSLPADQSVAQGWCLMNANRPAEAVDAFDRGLASTQAKVRSDAAYGKSLAYIRLGLTSNAAFAATSSDLDTKRATELQVVLLADRAVASFQAGRYSETINLLDRRARLATERVDLMVLRGYVYLKLKRYGDATRVFQSLAAIGNRDGVKGLADVKEAMNPSHTG
jgi:cellulose synthase operon protein C